MIHRHNSIARYFTNIFQALYTVVLGMRVTLKVMFMRAVTVQYPDAVPVIPDAFRGMHEYKQEDCIACERCIKECPVSCISIEYKGNCKNAHISSYSVDYTRCLFCNLCVEACPTGCIKLGKTFDLSSYDRAGCVREFAKDIYSDKDTFVENGAS